MEPMGKHQSPQQVVTKKLDKTSSAEDALDERCKQGLSRV